jgi:hypothetical protein
MPHYITLEREIDSDGDTIYTGGDDLTCDEPVDAICHQTCECDNWTFYRIDGVWMCSHYGDEHATPASQAPTCQIDPWMVSSDPWDTFTGSDLREGKHEVDLEWQDDGWTWDYTPDNDPTPYSTNFNTIAEYEAINGPASER